MLATDNFGIDGEYAPVRALSYVMPTTADAIDDIEHRGKCMRGISREDVVSTCRANVSDRIGACFSSPYMRSGAGPRRLMQSTVVSKTASRLASPILRMFIAVRSSTRLVADTTLEPACGVHANRAFAPNITNSQLQRACLSEY
jgi:hypothetical protein